ncbi:hypothetical protein BJ170DRAFT_599242 [Xylariales sp. AK1849]|nr:hypothetical protein BJ170DRAFT_599242 [Xylariales sp. AK1849]
MAPSTTLLHCSAMALVLLVSMLFSISSAQDACGSLDRPNPIAQQYPDLVTGNLNGTTLIIPISLATARDLIPQEYGILEEAYRSILPSFPQGMYPMMVSAKHDHDLQLAAYNLSIPDFSRAAYEFPFLDITGDGYTSYRLQKTVLMTASNTAAITGSEAMGIKAYPAEFDPPCDAYKLGPGGETCFNAGTAPQPDQQSKFMGFVTVPSPQTVPYPFEFIQNITNQVTFANTTYCDHYELHFNTSLSAAPYAPVPVVGTVSANLEPFTEPTTWNEVYGWQYAAAFTEPPTPQACPI